MTPVISDSQAWVSNAQAWAFAAFQATNELTMFDVVFNEVHMKLPAGTLLTMVHCAHIIDRQLHFLVETQHGNWMMNNLDNGDIFLDVGAATGASLLPIAMKKSGVRIIALEPTIRASRLLRATLEANNLVIELLNAAAYNSNGLFTFREFRYDPDAVPWQTEGSSLIDDAIEDGKAIFNRVPAVTIDGLGLKGERIVMKIDVEGSEAEVLLGAQNTIAHNEVKFSIDIHGDTGPHCRDILKPFGYRFIMEGHVLLCDRA